MTIVDWQREFLWVRKTFFPRWKGAGWQIANEGDWEALIWPRYWKDQFCGFCSETETRIFINPKSFPPGDRDRLRATILHEINHVFVAGHGTRFQLRLIRAIRKAERIVGCGRLVSILQQDLQTAMNIALEKKELGMVGAIYWQIALYGSEYRYLSFSEVIRDLFDDRFPPYFIRRRYPRALWWFRHERRRRKRLHKLWYSSQPAGAAAACGRASNG